MRTLYWKLKWTFQWQLDYSAPVSPIFPNFVGTIELKDFSKPGKVGGREESTFRDLLVSSWTLISINLPKYFGFFIFRFKELLTIPEIKTFHRGGIPTRLRLHPDPRMTIGSRSEALECWDLPWDAGPPNGTDSVGEYQRSGSSSLLTITGWSSGGKVAMCHQDFLDSLCWPNRKTSLNLSHFHEIRLLFQKS